MDNDRKKLLKQVNIDIIFFFLLLVQGMVSFYIINEKKKSILNIDCISNDNANTIYKYNRRLNFIICIYFFYNAYKNYKTGDSDDKQNSLLLAATFFILLGSSLYLPLGNSNLIIEN